MRHPRAGLAADRMPPRTSNGKQLPRNRSRARPQTVEAIITTAGCNSTGTQPLPDPTGAAASLDHPPHVSSRGIASRSFVISIVCLGRSRSAGLASTSRVRSLHHAMRLGGGPRNRRCSIRAGRARPCRSRPKPALILVMNRRPLPNTAALRSIEHGLISCPARTVRPDAAARKALQGSAPEDRLGGCRKQ